MTTYAIAAYISVGSIPDSTQPQPGALSSSEGYLLCPQCLVGGLGLGCVELSVSAATAAKSLQSCPTLCDPIDSSPPGSPVPGILQARTLEWVAISFSNA